MTYLILRQIINFSVLCDFHNTERLLYQFMLFLENAVNILITNV